MGHRIIICTECDSEIELTQSQPIPESCPYCGGTHFETFDERLARLGPEEK